MTQFLPATVPARNRNGAPAPAAKWDFYYENTLTSAPLIGGATSVTAGSTGIFPGITLDNNLTYRAVLKDADGRVISDISAAIDRHFAAGLREALDGSALVPGARWEFFNAGTTTPRPVFADPALQVSLGGMVEADASARFPEIYLNSASAYKAVIKRPNGTVMGTIDPVNASTMSIFLAGVAADGTFILGDTLYGPNWGPRGPRKIIFSVFNQGDIGYSYETNNVAEPLPAKWASRGINTWTPGGHPDGPLSGRATQTLAAVKAAGLMMIAAPVWNNLFQFRPDLAALDYRSLAMTDPYWRINWIAYAPPDEMDLQAFPLATHIALIAAMRLDGVNKPVSANFTRRVAVPGSGVGSATINFYEAFNAPDLRDLQIDSYEWHLDTTDANAATAFRTTPKIWVSPWNAENLPDWPRFTASVTGLANYIQRNGPLSPGKSDNGLPPVQYPPIAFNTPPFSDPGIFIAAQPMTYAPGDKSTGHHVATGRVDFNTNYPRGGQWQPGRFLRSEGLSGFVHGSSTLTVFPQTVGQFSITGYIDAVANTLVVTAAPPFPIAGALRVLFSGFNPSAWIRRDNPQLSGTPGGIGTYALDIAKVTPVAQGTAGAPVTLVLDTEGRPWGDDSNPENIAELVNLIANINRMQAHPTGGNLMIDPVQGGRRAFETMFCPEIDGDAALYKVDMTKAPVRASYTAGGVPILNALGRPPLWLFGWPVGFEGFRVTGDDGAVYSYVRSMSNGNAPTFFPGFAALGMPARVFGAYEFAGFRRVGSAAAVEMTGTSGVLKAGVDEGVATWFYIETAAIAQNEGNSGTTAYAITVRRGGVLTGTNTVTATVTGTGIAPANATDFAGGVFPSEVLSFAPTEATKVFTVNVAGDATAEFNETFKAALSAPSGGAVLVGSNKSEVICTITNDDAALTSNFVWLGLSLSAAPAITGAPASATFLNSSETTFITRAGIKMRAVGASFANNETPSVFGLPYWGLDNPGFHGVIVELAAGSWEAAFLAVADPGSGGTLSIVDDPSGLATVRYSIVIPTGLPLRIVDTDGTTYTDQPTGATDALNNLTFTAPITVTNLGGGVGQLWFRGTTPATLLSAIALRQA